MFGSSATCTSSLACLAALCLPVAAVAQAHVHPSGDNNSARERHSIRAMRADVAPKMDGVLDAAVWQKRPAVDEFTQPEPREGAAATGRIEVHVMYDSKNKNLPIAIHAFDAQSSGIGATEMPSVLLSGPRIGHHFAGRGLVRRLPVR